MELERRERVGDREENVAEHEQQAAAYQDQLLRAFEQDPHDEAAGRQGQAGHGGGHHAARGAEEGLRRRRATVGREEDRPRGSVPVARCRPAGRRPRRAPTRQVFGNTSGLKASAAAHGGADLPPAGAALPRSSRRSWRPSCARSRARRGARWACCSIAAGQPDHVIVGRRDPALAARHRPPARRRGPPARPAPGPHPPARRAADPRRPDRPGPAAARPGRGRGDDPDGRPPWSTRRTCCPVHAAPSAPGRVGGGADPWTLLEPVPLHELDLDFDELIRSLEEEFARAGPGRAAGRPGPRPRAAGSRPDQARPGAREEICLAELRELCRTAGVQVLDVVVQRREPARPPLRRRARQAGGDRAARQPAGRRAADLRPRPDPGAGARDQRRDRAQGDRSDDADPRHLRPARAQPRRQAPGGAGPAQLHPAAPGREEHDDEPPDRRHRRARPRRDQARDQPAAGPRAHHPPGGADPRS